MSDSDDKQPFEGQPSIREVMEAVRAAQEEEMRAEALAERKRRRKAQENRVRERRERQVTRAREAKARRQKAITDAQGKVAHHVSAATRELRAALRDATAVPMPRHSAEGREQLRVRRSIENALAALRRVGRGHFYDSDLDLDFDEVSS